MNRPRHTSKLIAVALGAFTSALSSLFAQTPNWQWTEGPYHGTANCFVKGPNNYLYAGTEVGVFRTPIDHDAWELASGVLLDREITALAVDSSGVLYAGTAQGVFRSFDEGTHWEIVNFGLGNNSVYALLAAPHGVVLAGTGDGIYRSTDQASSWTKTVTDSANASAVCFAVHPPSGALYAGGAIGLMRSTDDGEHWTHLPTGFTGCSALSINRRGFIAVVFYYPGGPGRLLGVSKDTARTFYSPELDPQWAVSVALDDANHLFLGTISRYQESYSGWLKRYQIVESSGPPLSVQLLNQQWGVAGPTRSVLATEGNRVFASAGDVISSADSGATFHNFMNGLTASRVISLVDNTRGTIFAGTEFALFHHPDTVSSWSNRWILGGDYFKPVLCLTADSSALILAGSRDMGGLYQWPALYLSTDFGVHWDIYNDWSGQTKGITIGRRGQLFALEGTAVVRAPDPNVYRILMWADSYLLSLVMRDSMELYAGSDLGTVYCSYDTGMTWTFTRLVPAGAVENLALASGGRVYAGTSVGFFVSSDRGSSWVQRGGGEVPSNIRVLAARPGVGVFAGTPEGVYRSCDEGEHWEALNDGLSVKEIYSFCFGTDGSLYAGTSGGGVFRLPLETMLSVQFSSFNVTQAAGGSVQLHWVTASEMDNYGFEVERRLTGQADFATVPNSFRPGHATSTATHEYTVVDSTPGIGQWQYRLKQMDIGGAVHYTDALSVQVTTDVKGSSERPSSFALQQNYPNPFNPRTVVSSQLPVASDVRIVIYDVLGREVAVLVNERRAAGRYRDSYDASAQASGVYVYRMTAGSFVATRKMILVK